MFGRPALGTDGSGLHALYFVVHSVWPMVASFVILASVIHAGHLIALLAHSWADSWCKRPVFCRCRPLVGGLLSRRCLVRLALLGPWKDLIAL